jgi:hypothetical protein
LVIARGFAESKANAQQQEFRQSGVAIEFLIGQGRDAG